MIVKLRYLGMLAIAPLVLVGFWFALRELAVAWYGFNLTDHAYDSANTLAGDRSYCLIKSHGATSFEELDVRQVISDAFGQRFGIRYFDFGFKKPHFGIKVDGSSYYWSFARDNFVELPGYSGNNGRAPCTGDLRGIGFSAQNN